MKNKLSRALEEEYKNSIGDDERSNCSDLDRGRDSKTIKVSQAESAAKENGLFRVLSVAAYFTRCCNVKCRSDVPRCTGCVSSNIKSLKVKRNAVQCNALYLSCNPHFIRFAIFEPVNVI